MAVVNAVPLIALDAVVLDTETTGLDPASARIVEIGAVRLAEGRVDTENAFHSLVRPGVPIPAAASRIHHIDDAKVADAPPFPEVWQRLGSFIGDAVVIGHSLGFDLAVLKRECERSNLQFEQPRTLDTRLLAQVAEPNLAGYSIEQLTTWLGIALSGRHSALGDAITTAHVFSGLVPKLRSAGIRTFAEATRACRALSSVLEDQHRAGWLEDTDFSPGPDRVRGLYRIDSYPFRHRVRDVMRSPARFATADTQLREVLAQLMAERISSLFILDGDNKPGSRRASEIGIVTERDVLRAISRDGAAALERPVSLAMKRPLAVVPADAFVYRAIGRMSRLGIRHLGAVDENGDVIGALSARDLLRLRASEAITLGDEIDEARAVPALGKAWAKLPHVAAALLAEGVGGRDIAAVVSRELGAATRQAAVIAEGRMRAEGHGDPPCPYAVAVLGSGGRGESLLAMDQDNALIFAEGDPGGHEDRWFEQLSRHIADILHEIGVPYCPGGVMAKSPQWRGSRATWSNRVGEWIGTTKPEHLLSVDIFFDLRPVHGDGRLCTELWRHAYDLADGNVVFAKRLIENAGGMESGLGLFRQFKTTEGRVDVKKMGLFGIVSAARALAIRHHILERSTPARLAGIRDLNIGAAADLDALSTAQETFLDLLAAQQVEDIEHGRTPSNTVAVKSLSTNDRARLRAAFDAVRHLDSLTRELLFDR
jgi:DNA polymerase-3 subunit epsilon/CBS domain-containing protein